jgi:hypothetical protein
MIENNDWCLSLYTITFLFLFLLPSSSPKIVHDAADGFLNVIDSFSWVCSVTHLIDTSYDFLGHFFQAILHLLHYFLNELLQLLCVGAFWEILLHSKLEFYYLSFKLKGMNPLGIDLNGEIEMRFDEIFV